MNIYKIRYADVANKYDKTEMVTMVHTTENWHQAIQIIKANKKSVKILKVERIIDGVPEALFDVDAKKEVQNGQDTNS